ncbi:MAG: type II secretion system protein [Bacilli bacterium]|nr:type II secretion system protein [Bacilli bacterium]
MENKGFTLVEILAVITIMSMLVVIAIPATQSIARKANEKMYNSKIDIAIQSAKLWAIDNIDCFKKPVCEKIISAECKVIKANVECYSIILDTLVNEGYYDYDDEVNERIIDPRNKSQENDLNETPLLINYNTSTKKIDSIIIQNELNK